MLNSYVSMKNNFWIYYSLHKVFFSEFVLPTSHWILNFQNNPRTENSSIKKLATILV